jgi:hypothetical protein
MSRRRNQQTLMQRLKSQNQESSKEVEPVESHHSKVPFNAPLDGKMDPCTLGSQPASTIPSPQKSRSDLKNSLEDLSVQRQNQRKTKIITMTNHKLSPFAKEKFQFQGKDYFTIFSAVLGTLGKHLDKDAAFVKMLTQFPTNFNKKDERKTALVSFVTYRNHLEDIPRREIDQLFSDVFEAKLSSTSSEDIREDDLLSLDVGKQLSEVSEYYDLLLENFLSPPQLEETLVDGDAEEEEEEDEEEEEEEDDDEAEDDVNSSKDVTDSKDENESETATDQVNESEELLAAEMEKESQAPTSKPAQPPKPMRKKNDRVRNTERAKQEDKEVNWDLSLQDTIEELQRENNNLSRQLADANVKNREFQELVDEMTASHASEIHHLRNAFDAELSRNDALTTANERLGSTLKLLEESEGKSTLELKEQLSETTALYESAKKEILECRGLLAMSSSKTTSKLQEANLDPALTAMSKALDKYNSCPTALEFTVSLGQFIALTRTVGE